MRFIICSPLAGSHEGVKQLERVVEEDPLNVGMRSALIHALHADGQDERAIAEAHKILAEDKNRWNVHLVLARIYAFRGQLPEALGRRGKGI